MFGEHIPKELLTLRSLLMTTDIGGFRVQAIFPYHLQNIRRFIFKKKNPGMVSDNCR